MNTSSCSPWLPALAAIILSACTTETVVSSHDVDQSYNSLQLGFVTQNDEEIPVVVVGNPFGSTTNGLNSAILAGMKGSNFGPVVEFAINPERPATQKSRVLIIFNPDSQANPDDMCRTEPVSENGIENNIQAAAAYCENSIALTRASFRVSDVSGPESPKFHNFAVALAQTLFPPYNPHVNGSSEGCVVC